MGLIMKILTIAFCLLCAAVFGDSVTWFSMTNYVGTNGTYSAGSVSTNQFLPPTAYPGLAAYYDSSSFAALPDGANVNGFWNDLSGNGNNLTISNAVFSFNGLNGMPCVGFFSTSAMATNSGFFNRYPTINSNFTMIATFNVVSSLQGANGRMFAASGADYQVKFDIDTDSSGVSDIDIESRTNSVSGNPGMDSIVRQRTPQAHVLAVNYNGTNFNVLVDGKMSLYGLIGSTQYGPGFAAGGAGLTGDLYLGNIFGGPNPMNGNIGKMLVFTNCLSLAQLESASAYYDTGLSGNTVFMLGDSITKGDHTTNGASWGNILQSAFPNWRIAQEANDGNNSAQMLTNLYLILPELHRGSFNAVVCYSAVNDRSAGFTTNQTELNFKAMSALCHSNDVAFIIGTAMDWTNGDLSDFYKTNLNTLTYANASAFDAIIPYDTLAAGSNGACLNPILIYSGDYTHPVAYTYNLSSNILCQTVGSVYAKRTPAGKLGSVTNQINNISGIITNGGVSWIFYQTNANPGPAFTNYGMGSICSTTNGQMFVLSNSVWLQK